MKIPTHSFLLYFCLLWPYQPAHGGDYLLKDYIKTALESNTEILSARLARDATQQEAHISSALPDPTFMIEGRGLPLDISDITTTRELMFMLEQMFPAPGVLRRMRKNGEFAADIQIEMLNAVENEIIWAVKDVYYQIYYLDQTLATNDRHLQLMSEFEKSAESKYVVGKTEQQALYHIRIEKARLETDRLSLLEQRSSLAAEMNRLLRRRLDGYISTDSTIIMPILSTVTNSDSLLERSNPFLRAARIRIAASENDLELMRAGKRPAFHIMGGYMVMNDMNDALMGRVSMTLPFMPWSRQDTRAALEKSRILARQAVMDYQTLLDKFRVQLIALRNELSAFSDQIDLYSTEIIPASEQTVALSIVGYQSDRLDFLSLVQYAREHLQYQLAHIELSNRYVRTWAKLENLIGTSTKGELK
ncbi:TolC family protein [candidate division KSB1 bacterium]|nr:TolC family protein [candidate division KSB1 bacterium]